MYWCYALLILSPTKYLATSDTWTLYKALLQNFISTYSGSKSVPILSHFEEIRELLDIKKESGKVPAGWMNRCALGIPKLHWSCDLVAMEARYRHFKMTCHWDTYLTLHVSIIISYIT